MDVAGFRRRYAASIPIAAMLVVAVGLTFGCSLMGPTTATSFLNKIEQSPDPNERFLAYEKLASERIYDDPEQKTRAVKVLIVALQSNKEPAATRAVICRTLGTLGDSAGREPMLALITDSDVLIRTEACRSLGRLGRPEDATVLMRMMTLDNNPDCKVAAIDALGTLKAVDPRTKGFLVQTMEDSDDPAIRLACLQAMRKLTGKDLGVKPEAWRADLANPGLPPLPQPAAGSARRPTLDTSTLPVSTPARR